MLGILGKKGDHYADQTMTSSHKNTELRSQETTGQEDRKGRKEETKEVLRKWMNRWRLLPVDRLK